MKKSWLLFGLLFLLVGCISFKSDFIRVDYYRLEQETTTFQNLGSVDCSLQIKVFEPIGNFDGDMLFAQWENGRIQKYHYNKWVNDCPTMITDFIINRFNRMKAFEGGVYKDENILQTDYIMEGQIIDMTAYSFQQNKSNNDYVNIILKITLIKNNSGDVKKMLMSKLYSVKIPRKDNSIESIPPAFSKGFSQITDDILNDLQDIIVKDKSH